MANDLLVRILGDTKGLERSFAQANRSTTQFGRRMDTAGTKADRAAKSFSAFGRGALAGFGGAVALNTATEAIASTISAAAEAQQVLGQTRVAVEQTGKSWAQYGETIERAVQEQSRLGFDDEALLRTFSLFVRQSDDVGEALRRNNIAMDVARARFIDLEQAAALVNKAALGQAGALRRVGIDAQKGASGVELLAQLEREFGGAAEDAAGTAQASFDRFNVAVENLQENLGSTLLPVMTELANSLSDAAEGAALLVDGLRAIGNVRIPEIEIPMNITIGGGTIGGAIGRGFDLAKFTPLNPFFAPTIVKGIADRLRGDTAATKDVTAAANTFESNVIPGFVDIADLSRRAEKAAVSANKAVKSFGDKGFKPLARSWMDVQRAALDANMSTLELGLARAQITESVGDDIAALEKIAAALRGAIKKGVDVADNELELARVLGQIADARRSRGAAAKQAAASAAADAAERRRVASEKAAAIRQAAAERLQAQQFRSLGLSATGDEIIPGFRNLAQRIDGAMRRIQSGELDVSSKLVERLKLARNAIKKEGKNLTDDTRDTINQLIKTVTGGMQKAEDAVPERRVVNLSDKIIRALGFDKDPDVARLFGGGNAPSLRPIPAPVSATAGGVNISGPITVVADNPDAFLRELQKKAGRTSATSRGRFPGRSLGLG